MENFEIYASAYAAFVIPAIIISSYFIARSRVINPGKYAFFGLFAALVPVIAILWLAYLYFKEPDEEYLAQQSDKEI